MKNKVAEQCDGSWQAAHTATAAAAAAQALTKTTISYPEVTQQLCVCKKYNTKTIGSVIISDLLDVSQLCVQAQEGKSGRMQIVLSKFHNKITITMTSSLINIKGKIAGYVRYRIKTEIFCFFSFQSKYKHKG